MDTQQHVFLDRASRGTRGKRMTRLLDEEIEEDELFWNQDALKEEDIDVDYQEEAEVADVYDSDFDEDEPEADEEVENEPDERTRTKKKLIFPGKSSTKKKKNKVLSKLEKAPIDEKTVEQSTPSEHHDAPDDLEAEKIVRKSSRTSVIIRQAERDAIRAALQATMKPIKKKKEGEEKRMTQEEMLLEAAQTEIMNLRNLEKVLAREEEVKKRAVVHKQVYNGPQIRFLSRDGYSFLDFMNGSSFQSEISTTKIPYCKACKTSVAFCIALLYYNYKSVLPASYKHHLLFMFTNHLEKHLGEPHIILNYRDPKTGLPYATKEAFKIIRERFGNENKCQKKESSVGLVCDITSQQGFCQKRKRSMIPHTRETSCFADSARFRRIPALEIQDSD